ncbi:MAG: hypothetical protein KC464_27035 [Myxococcales bacterium]|nr:hypothetical protein [Myxococcales bacterium]
MLDLDVVHAVVGSDAEDPHGGGRYVDAMLAADDPKTVVDAVEERGGLGRAKKPLPESNAPVLCARVIAGVLERRMLARGVIRTSPGYFDQAGYVVALDWAAEVAGVTEELARARASGREHDESPFVQHLFALHASEAVLGQGAPVETRFVAFDLRTGGAHVVHRGSQARSSLSLLDAYAASGRRLGPLLDWVETWL